MRAVVRALIALLTLGICLVFAVPGAAARTLPVGTTDVVTAVAVTASAELPAWPTIRQGSLGQPVRRLQYLLKARGACVAVDGIFGPRTTAALRTYQGIHGLVVDGIVGPQTWRSVIITVRFGNPARRPGPPLPNRSRRRRARPVIRETAVRRAGRHRAGGDGGRCRAVLRRRTPTRLAPTIDSPTSSNAPAAPNAPFV